MERETLKAEMKEVGPRSVARRRDLYCHPEVASEEVRTSGIAVEVFTRAVATSLTPDAIGAGASNTQKERKES